MEERHDHTPQEVETLERQITRLLEQRQRAVRYLTFSCRLREVRPMAVRLMVYWEQYQQAARPPHWDPLDTPAGQRHGVDSPMT